MQSLRLCLAAALLTSGCFLDSLGVPPPSGGAPASGGADGGGGEPSTNGSGGAGGAPDGGGGMGGALEGGAPAAQHCPPGEVVANIEDGIIACAPIAQPATAAIAEGCAVFYGWRDNCSAGCTTAPDRFGKVTSAACTSATGNSTCQTHDLGPDLAVPLFGLDLDGGVDDGDRFYAALSCQPGGAVPAPCDAGGFVTAYDGATPVCSRISGAVLDYVRPSCALVTGWRDQCTNCTTAPQKYVSSTTLACNTGDGGACAEVALGADTVQLGSFDTDGIVGEDDKFYIGLRCESVTSTEAPARDACPPGEFLVGLAADGELVCSGLQEAAMTAFRERCALFYGWRDGCDACTSVPTKWGRVKDGDCDLGTGADDTCSTMMLGGQGVALFGLNTDGGVNDNDKLYIGFRCE